MSLTATLQHRVYVRFQMWVDDIDVPVGLTLSIWILDMLDVDYRSADSPYRIPRPEVPFPSEAERIMNDFVRGIKEIQEQQRGAIMEAITRRNNLHSDVERLQSLSDRLEHEAKDALVGGDREAAKQKLKEKAKCDQELQIRQGELAEVEASVEELKRGIRHAEEQLKAQAEEALKQHPMSMAEAQRPEFASQLRSTLDALAVGQDEAKLIAELAPEQADLIPAEEAGAAAPIEDAPKPISTEPVTVELNFTPEAEALIAERAKERDLTSEAYIIAVAEHLVDLADLVTPLAMPPAPDGDSLAAIRAPSVEEIVSDAVREMKEAQIRQREYAVKVLTQKNNLRAEVDRETRIIAEYERKALQALDEGNRELAQQFYKEKLIHEPTLQTMRVLLTQATETAEKVKQQIRQEEERIRVRTSKALVLRANMTASAIAFQLDTLLEETGLPVQAALEQDFDAWVQSQRPAPTQSE